MTTRIEKVSAPADEVNVWIIGDDDEVIVIDPGHNPAAVLDAVGDREVLAVICTHGHAEHVAAAVAVAERDEAPVALHPKDRLLPDFAGQLTAIGEHLLTLPSDIRVLPGQGQETTIAAAEKKFDSWVSTGPVLADPD
jgi:glyoxylase-like metal-dependent hydrolase (beta-lactamase superfamily II)